MTRKVLWQADSCNNCGDTVANDADEQEQRDHKRPCTLCGQWDHAACNHPIHPDDEGGE